MIEWAVASRRLGGEEESGDAHVAVAYEGGMLLGVVDGLGHGREAAVASRTAVSVLESQAGADVVGLVESCHERLKHTRGAVIALAAVVDEQPCLTWIGIGDSEAILVRSDSSARPRERLLLRPGIIGHRLPSLSAESLPLHPGDVLVMATDGLRSAWVDGIETGREPQAMADHLLGDYARDYDDALVLVARFGGEP